MKHLIERNFKAIVKRGKITSITTTQDFINKIKEELGEFIEAVNEGLPNENEELADIILTCLNYARFYDIDIEQELNKKIIKNENRND